MQTFLNWIDGNKTIFGLVIAKLNELIPPDYLAFGVLPLHTVLGYLAGLLITVGATHKIVKGIVKVATTNGGTQAS